MIIAPKNVYIFFLRRLWTNCEFYAVLSLKFDTPQYNIEDLTCQLHTHNSTCEHLGDALTFLTNIIQNSFHLYPPSVNSDLGKIRILAMNKEKKSGFDFYRSIGSPVKLVAPMVDASELAWRMLGRRHGADLCYTPMLHSGVFVRDKKYRVEALQTCPQDRPLIGEALTSGFVKMQLYLHNV